MDTLGRRVKARRKEMGLSQLELTERSGVSQSTLSRVESDAGSASIDNIKAIATALETTVAQLSGEPGPTRDLVVVPEGESLSVPILRNYPGWEELKEAVRALDSKIPEWVYEVMDTKSPFLAGPLHPAAVRDFARVIWKHSTPPAAAKGRAKPTR